MIAGRLPLILVVLAAALTQARAAPLDADACAKLQSEQAALERAGIEQDMAKGPDWARANLPAEKLRLVRRFIEIEAQLLFRCRSKAIVHAPLQTEKDNDDDNNKETASKSAKQGKAGSKASQPPRKPAASPMKHGSESAAETPAKGAVQQSTEPGVTSIVKRPPADQGR